jgi:hypothetical protein
MREPLPRIRLWPRLTQPSARDSQGAPIVAGGPHSARSRRTAPMDLRMTSAAGWPFHRPRRAHSTLRCSPSWHRRACE